MSDPNQNQAERRTAIGETAHTYRDFLDGCSTGAILVEFETERLAYANPKAAELLEYGRDELENRRMSDLIPESKRENAVSEIEKLTSGEKIILLDFPCLKKNGKIRHVDIHGNRTCVGDHNFHVLFLADSIHRKSVEEYIRQTEEKYRTILDSIGQGYYEVDLKGNFTFFNDSLCRLFGFSESELKGTNFRKFMYPETAEKVFGIFRKVYETGLSDKGFIWEYVRKDGSIRQIGSSVFPITNKTGRKIGFRGIARDISERKITENQMAQNQKLESIGRLAAGIAHEINTPTQYVGDNTHFLKDAFEEILNIIVKFEDLLQVARCGTIPENLLEDSETAIKAADLEYLKEEIPLAIAQSIEGLERVTSIVSAMKEFSYPGGEEKTPVNINKSIAATITITRSEWKYVAEMKTDFDAHLPAVPILPDEFNQVILNMIINAAHAISDVVGDTPDRGTIRISTRRDDDWAEIRIADTGPGIPQMIRSVIFDPFFTTKGIGKGTGQGLAISHAIIVKKHSGSVRFETEMDKGTTFIIRIPLFEKRNGE